MLIDIENEGYHTAHRLLQRVSLGGIVLDIHLFAGETKIMSMGLVLVYCI